MFFVNLILVNCLLTTNTKFNITCVSLKREVSRREHINNILSFADTKYRIVNAVDGNEIFSNSENILKYSKNQNFIDYFKKHEDVSENLYGAVGLKLTSYALFREYEELKTEKPLLILEDDVDLELDFVNIIENTLSNMNDNWDIILLTPSYYVDYNRPTNKLTGLRGINFFSGTYAYLINGSRAAKKLADLLENCDPKFPIDFYFGEMSCSRFIIGYAFTTSIATHLGNVFASSIATSDYVGPEKLVNSLYLAELESNK